MQIWCWSWGSIRRWMLLQKHAGRVLWVLRKHLTTTCKQEQRLTITRKRNFNHQYKNNRDSLEKLTFLSHLSCKWLSFPMFDWAASAPISSWTLQRSSAPFQRVVWIFCRCSHSIPANPPWFAPPYIIASLLFVQCNDCLTQLNEQPPHAQTFCGMSGVVLLKVILIWRNIRRLSRLLLHNQIPGVQNIPMPSI